MRTKFEKITVIFICTIILLLGVLLIILPKKEYSANENRYLAKPPVFTVSNLTSGDYMDSIKEYLTDHFPFRDFWVSLNTTWETTLGKRKINGIYLGKDNYLIGEYKTPENTDRIIKTFSKFNDSISSINEDANINLCLVPTAVTIMDEKLPSCASKSTQLSTISLIAEKSGLNNIDITNDLMSAKNDYQLYYRTDHHWTSYGAYICYREFCKNAGITPANISDFDSKDVTSDFHGTLSAKVNRFNEEGDVITVFEDPSAKLTVYYEDTKETTDTLFNMDYLNERDMYSLFLNNLHPLITIHNDNATTNRVLMLVKDSYANCLVPFLVHDFSDIYVFDTRYYKDGPSNFYQDHPEISDILILYNMNTIDNDTGIRGIY